MWVWVLKLLPGAKSFITAYWKPLGIGILLISVFLAGGKWESIKYEKEKARMAEATAAAISQREQEIRARYEAQALLDAEARRNLQHDIRAISQREKDLLSQVRQAQLVKPVPDVICEGIEEINGETIIVANPFNKNFVKIWNESSRSHLP